MKEIHLESYLSNGVERIIKGIVKASAREPKTALYMLKYAKAGKKARKLREDAEREGGHIPPFLIASITSQCNLSCKGCYARANNSCGEIEAGTRGMLSAEQWKNIFDQAADLGISFILLAGGEPLLRRDVMKAAGLQREILFPVFTNGTLLGKEYLEFFGIYRNLLPILSIEGKEATTDARRGTGVYRKLLEGMEKLQQRNLLFGASVTVHKQNQKEVLSAEFIRSLSSKGCKALIYVEYVPIEPGTEILAFDDNDRMVMAKELKEWRSNQEEMLFLSFPGDEKSSGGCLAAGRGFFHINAYGGAEPCPFSPYSDTSLKETSLKDALKSPLFQKLSENGNLTEEHLGGCVLFAQEKQVQKFMTGEMA